MQDIGNRSAYGTKSDSSGRTEVVPQFTERGTAPHGFGCVETESNIVNQGSSSQARVRISARFRQIRKACNGAVPYGVAGKTPPIECHRMSSIELEIPSLSTPKPGVVLLPKEVTRLVAQFCSHWSCFAPLPTLTGRMAGVQDCETGAAFQRRVLHLFEAKREYNGGEKSHLPFRCIDVEVAYAGE